MIGADPLQPFHPVIRTWFAARMGTPTEAQRLAWPAVAAGEHVLLAAPTGSGKTLAAFLWALDRLLTGAWSGEATRVLYVSPLRALGTDVRRNLLQPLAELRERFEAAGLDPPQVRVLTRSGDTPVEERRRMTRRPPEVLITTPESLNILLTSQSGRAGLAGVRCVILDEVHAVVETKRGVHLITAVERLVRLAGEVQRLALSATVRPLDEVARWVGGAAPAGEDPLAPPLPRPVRVLASSERKRYELSVSFPAAALDDADESTPEHWPLLVAEVLSRVRANRSTLVFANSRRLVEKLSRFLNDAADGELVYSHHGSLAREIRGVVEKRLKAGALRGIVATSSLELGIDIGTLDEVVLVQTPFSLASAAQRIGRAGHTVGGVARARFVPLFARDLLDAAVIADAVLEGEIEPLRPLTGALDVLAQVVVSATASESWDVDELFALVRRCYPYRNLPRRQFDLVLEMLSGRYATSRIRELDPVISVDRVAGGVRGRPGAARRVYSSGGTIPDRGAFRLRLADTRALVGELDEEFVWERSVGDSFCFGVRTYRIAQITDADVLVRPATGPAGLAPFWRADERDRPFERAERVGRFLEAIEPRLGDSDLPERLAAGGRYTLAELATHTGLSSAELTRQLWSLAWLGLVTNDGFAAMRRGVDSGFAPASAEPPPPGHGARRRLRFAQWQGTRPLAGSWLPTLPPPAEEDLLAGEELLRDRVRLLLSRYGVVFRELLARELPALQYSRIARTLRLMELGGEVVGGPFFERIGGLQLASPAAVRRLAEGVVADRVVAIPALDPASPCGLGLDGMPDLPRRLPGNWTVWQGSRLVATIERRGAALTFRVPPEHPDLHGHITPLKLLLGRSVRPERALTVETINGTPASSSPYRSALATLAQTVTDGARLRLLRRW